MSGPISIDSNKKNTGTTLVGPVTTSLGTILDGKSKGVNLPVYIIRPISELVAKKFFATNHDHSSNLVGRKFSLGAYDQSGSLRAAIVVVANPKTCNREAEKVLEIHRCCSDACNPTLVGRLITDAKRAIQALGYRQIKISKLAFNAAEKPTYPVSPNTPEGGKRP